MLPVETAGATPNFQPAQAPASSPAPTPAPDPKNTSVYQEASSSANAAYQSALNSIQQQQQLLYQQYGFNPDGSVDKSNPYGLYQQAMTSDQWAQDAANTDWSRAQQDNSTAVGLENQSFQDLLQSIATSRTRDQSSSGLNATFDALMNPTGLHMDAKNDHSQYADLLRGEADSLVSADEQGQARGLDGSGLGAQAHTRQAFANEGQNKNFKQQLINALTDLATQQKQGTTAHQAKISDLKTALDRALSDYNTKTSQLKYKTGLDQYTTTQGMKAALAALQAQASGASTNYQAALNNALLSSIMSLAGS